MNVIDAATDPKKKKSAFESDRHAESRDMASALCVSAVLSVLLLFFSDESRKDGSVVSSRKSVREWDE